MLEKKADSIHIAMHKTFKLVETTGSFQIGTNLELECAETHVDRSRLVETVSRLAEDFSTLNLPCNSYLHKLYHVKKNNLKRNFERLFKRMGLYFFHFDEFHVDDYLYDGIDTEDGFLAVLGILKFDKFTTTTCFHISTYQEAIEGKTTKLRCSGHDMEGDDEDDLKSFDEIEWSDTPVETITYLIDNIADHVPNIKFPFCGFERDQFLAVFTNFANIVERSLHSNRRGISINLDGQAFCSDTIEELASRFPTPAKRQMLGHSITLIYTNEYGTDSYVSLILIPQFTDPEMVPMSFQLNFSSNP